MDRLIEQYDVGILTLEPAVDAKNDLEGTSTQDIERDSDAQRPKVIATTLNGESGLGPNIVS